MTNINPVQKLGIALLREKLATRKPKNLNEALDAILWRFKIDSETGDIHTLDMLTNKPTGQTVESFLDNLMVDRADLFESRPNTGGNSSVSSSNPFAKGSSFNISKQMLLINTNPTEAKKLADEAGVKL